MDSLRRLTPEELTPNTVQAVDGMRTAFIAAFRSTAGLGSAKLAMHAWTAWCESLLRSHGVKRADESAHAAAVAQLITRGRYAFTCWITANAISRAVRTASGAACSCA